MARFDGVVALVSGAARGMGEANVRGLVAEGARVVIGDVLDAEGHALADDLGDAATFVHLDVTKGSDWEAAVSVAESMGALSVLVNNAGILRAGLITEMTEESFREVIDVNQIGVWLGMRAGIPAIIRAGGGSVVNISSTAGLVGYAGNGAYVASKWAVRGMTKSAALEFGRDGVRVNSVHPGPVRTPMIAGLGDDISAGQPIPRLGEPEEITRAVLFLASSEASYITGAELAVDGGSILGSLAPLE
jgi:3alpha(or 20beta)-hydroxysteroid dehydrogenase